MRDHLKTQKASRFQTLGSKGFVPDTTACSVPDSPAGIRGLLPSPNQTPL